MNLTRGCRAETLWTPRHRVRSEEVLGVPMKITSFVCVAFVLGGAAVADSAALPTPAGGPRDQSAASGPAGASAASEASPAGSEQSATELQEVVVTAEKRTTNLQQTPIAATVLSGPQLLKNGVITVDQLETVSPS